MPVRKFVLLIALVIGAAGVTVALGAGLASSVSAPLSILLVPVLLGAALLVRGLAGRRVGRGKASRS